MTSTNTQPKKLQDEKGGAATRSRPERSHSFHGRTAALPSDHRQLGRPKTQPDLLAGTGARKSGTGLLEPRAPAKVRLNVTVQGSLSPVQVMASAEWTVEEVIAAVVRVYVKEGRRPRLASTESGAFGLHYSQFSMECLDSKEKLSTLGSRNFFLCPKSISTAVTSSSTHSSSSTMPVSSQSCFQDVDKGSEINNLFRWLMAFLTLQEDNDLMFKVETIMKEKQVGTDKTAMWKPHGEAMKKRELQR